MSIQNIKELFSKRVQESVEFKKIEEEKPEKNGHEEENGYDSVRETDVGITEYLNDCKGFSAVIKQRFSDFQVHEIDLDGNPAYLTHTNIPEVVVEPVDETVVPEEIWEKLKKLSEKEIESVEIDVTDFSKEKRRDFHKAIKSKYGSKINSNTVDAEDKKTLVVRLGKDTNRQEPWFADLGKYLHFILFKTNKDTADAVGIIASKIKTKSSNFTYAGTKDKRAKTSQWVSMWHLDAKKLKGVNSSLRDIQMGNFVYKDEPLKLGDLKGNLFEIALRNVTESDEVINSALIKIKENGFINYFGLQRFGMSIEVPTHDIGRALVQGNFKSAAELILKPRKGKMKNDLKEARMIWWKTRDAEKALRCLNPRDRSIEAKLLAGLAKHGKNAYVNALDLIPRNVRLLYLHAYQSFIWNRVLSKRIKKYGKAVIEGDLVYTDQNEVTPTEEEEEGEETPSKSVRHLSQEEISNFSLADILHPLPGYNVTYPNNEIKDWYEELLKEDDLTSETMKQTVKQYSLSGTHRHIVKNIKDLSWHICHYSEPEEDLILSDLDKLKGISLNINQNSDNKYKAVVLKFSLDSSTYATMALREILKVDTSVAYQVTLNNYSNKRTAEDDGGTPTKKNKM